MRKSYLIGVAVFMASLVGFGIAAQSFTTVNTSQYWGKTGIPALTSAIDANFSALTTTDDVTFNNITATSNIIAGGSVDADNVTVDAGAGIDNQAAGTLVVGEATATKVEIADTLVETEVQGTLDVHEEANFVSSVAVGTTLGLTKTTIAMTEGLILTNLSCYVSLTTTGAVTGSVSTAIADGSTGNTFLIIENAGAHDVIIKDGANTKFSGDLTLTGGANDTLKVLWNGTDWIGLGLTDN
jgi:hypothetical protein